MSDNDPTIPPTKPARIIPAVAFPDDEATPVTPAPKWINPISIALAVVAAVLGLTLAVYWVKLAARDTIIIQNKNHADQVQAGAVELQSKLDADKVNTARLQLQLKEAEANSNQNKLALDKAKADSVVLQEQLEATRVSSTRFQTQSEEAKVTSIKHQGAVEVAVAQNTVLQTHLKQAQAEHTKSERLLVEANRSRADLESKIAQLQKDLLAAQTRTVGRK